MKNQPPHNEILSLTDDFASTPTAAWIQAAEKLLKGKAFAKTLKTSTFENILLQPIYNQQDLAGLNYLNALPGEAPYLRGNRASGYCRHSWNIAQEIAASTAGAFHASLKNALRSGQNAMTLRLDALPSDRKATGNPQFGTLVDFETALADVDLEKTPIFIDCGMAGFPAAALLTAYCKKHSVPLRALHGGIAFDPFRSLVTSGTLPDNAANFYRDMGALTHWSLQESPHLQTIGVDLRPYRNAGANAVQELAFALATGADYLRGILTQNKMLTVESVAPKIRFSFAVGSHFFMEISKLRAARILWSQMVKAFGGSADAQKMTIHAQSSVVNKSRMDAHVNILRGTTEALAAIFGGCDSLNVEPFDSVLDTTQELSRRIARNTQLILREESHVDKVADPAGGSWYVERLTADLTQKAWELFQEIEKNGGMLASLKNGFVQKIVTDTANKRAARLKTCKDKMIGTNIYPNLKDENFNARAASCFDENQPTKAGNSHKEKKTLLTFLQNMQSFDTKDSAQSMYELTKAMTAGAHLADLFDVLHPEKQTSLQVQALHIIRLSEPFERLRLTLLEHERKTGGTPKALIAKIGAENEYKAAADFASDFLQIAGFTVLNPQTFQNAQDAAMAALQSNANVVVLCAADGNLPDIVPPFAKRLKQENPETALVVHAAPEKQTDTLKDSGVDAFIYDGVDMVESLLGIFQKLKITL